MDGEYRRPSPGGGGLASVHPSKRNSCASPRGRQARTHVFHRTVGECRVSVRGCASGLHRDAVLQGASRPALAWHGVGAVVDIVAVHFPGIFLSGVAARGLDRQIGPVADCGAGEGQPVTPAGGGHVASAAIALARAVRIFLLQMPRAPGVAFYLYTAISTFAFTLVSVTSMSVSYRTLALTPSEERANSSLAACSAD